MQDEEPVGAPQHDEGRRQQRIDERLAVVQPIGRGSGTLDPADERRPRLRFEVHAAAALQEDPFRSGRELLPHADQVLALELHVPVAREAVPEAVVGGLVALEAERHDRELHGEGEPEQERTQEQGRHRAGIAPQAPEPGRPRHVHGCALRAVAPRGEAGRVEERQILAQQALTLRRLRHARHQFIQALHLAYPRGDVVTPAGALRFRAERRSSRRIGFERHHGVGNRAPALPGHDRGIDAIAEDFAQPVGVGRHDRLAHRQRLERRQWRALPERREHHQVERGQDACHVALEAEEVDAIGDTQVARLRLELGLQFTLAGDVHVRVGHLIDDRTHRVDEVLIALRRHQSCDRADRRTSPGRCPAASRAAAISWPLRGRPNSSSGAPR